MPDINDRSLRDALGRFPSGVTVVTTVDAGTDHAMTASAFCAVSLEPPLVLVCSQRTSRFHDAVLRSGRWGVSVLAAGAEETSRWFADRGRALDGQLDRVPHRRGASGVALLEESVAWLECVTEDVHPAGDHSIVVGRVVAAGVGPEEDPLVHHRSGYHRIATPGS